MVNSFWFHHCSLAFTKAYMYIRSYYVAAWSTLRPNKRRQHFGLHSGQVIMFTIPFQLTVSVAAVVTSEVGVSKCCIIFVFILPTLARQICRRQRAPVNISKEGFKYIFHTCQTLVWSLKWHFFSLHLSLLIGWLNAGFSFFLFFIQSVLNLALIKYLILL